MHIRMPTSLFIMSCLGKSTVEIGLDLRKCMVYSLSHGVLVNTVQHKDQRRYQRFVVVNG